MFYDVISFLERKGVPAFRVKQWQQAYFKEKTLTVDGITTFPEDLRAEIKKQWGTTLLPLTVLSEIQAEQSRKYLFQLSDLGRIESVYMQFQGGIQSLCISTQVGCPCACKFCATGGIGFRRNLTVDEIVGQVLYVAKTTSGVDRITIMGMGEALMNPNIFDALRQFTDPKLLGMSPQKISVSTVGFIPGLQKLIDQDLHVTLTFSLHFAEQKLREQWMPTAKTYALEAIFETLDAYVRKTHRKIYLAYTLLEGVNNRPQDVECLKKLWHQRGDLAYLYHINLIPFHPIPGLDISGTQRSSAMQFQKKLEQHGIPATVRQSFGESIQGACGQLAAGYSVEKKGMK